MIQIQGLELIEDTCLNIALSDGWDVDEALPLAEKIIGLIDDAHTTETILGADRVTLRFTAWTYDYMCHLEGYSQGCWIESLIGDSAAVSTLHEYLLPLKGTFL